MPGRSIDRAASAVETLQAPRQPARPGATESTVSPQLFPLRLGWPNRRNQSANRSFRAHTDCSPSPPRWLRSSWSDGNLLPRGCCPYSPRSTYRGLSFSGCCPPSLAIAVPECRPALPLAPCNLGIVLARCVPPAPRARPTTVAKQRSPATRQWDQPGPGEVRNTLNSCRIRIAVRTGISCQQRSLAAAISPCGDSPPWRGCNLCVHANAVGATTQIERLSKLADRSCKRAGNLRL